MSEIQKFARDVTRRYLQSIVFVDDEIYVPVPNKHFEAAAAKDAFDLPQRMHVMKPKAGASQLASTPPAPSEPEAFHPKQLVESFARQRMVCALYEPQKGFETHPTSEIFTLCERADVVILDWDLHKQEGRNILPLISGLVKQSASTVPHHVRLCAIYTATPNLHQVTNLILEHFGKEGLKPDVASETVLRAGASRIVVLGKPVTGRPPEQKDSEVAEKDLAERIICEFASMHEGILPALALHGLATVRTGAKKMLDKFHADMDGAFLVHRALLLPDDAFEQVPELLAEEALAVMLDDQVPIETTAKLSAALIDSKAIKVNLTVRSGAKEKPLEIAPRLLKGGIESVKSCFDAKNLNGSCIDNLHKAMSGGNLSAAHRLAALYNLRTQYGGRKDLILGTVIRHNEGESTIYSLCLMPICDSVRLASGKAVEFPFWRLRQNIPTPQSRGLVVELPGGEFVQLFQAGKPRDNFWLGKFEAGESGTVSVSLEKDRHLIKGVDGLEVEWVAQLKPSHAQRIA